MPAKTRVHELAQELGVTSKELLAKLRAQGEFVRSAASTLEAPVVRRLREQYPGATSLPSKPTRPTPPPPPVSSQRTAREILAEALNDPFSPHFMQPRKRRPGPYRGEAPEGLTKFLLDNHVVPRIDGGRRPKGYPYWHNEYLDAKKLADEWAMTHLVLSFDEILLWVRSGMVGPEYAVQLHQAGVKPQELGWHWEDGQALPLAYRLEMKLWTVEQVVTEVERRRALD